MTLLTAIRGQEHMVKRWVRLRDTSDGFERVLERLDVTDDMIERLAVELLTRETDNDDDATDVR